MNSLDIKYTKQELRQTLIKRQNLKKEDIFHIDDIFHKNKKKIYSQNYEDGIIEIIFSIIKPKYKFYVEFGGADGIWLSNTANLRINHNWKGLLLEGDKDKINPNNDINLKNEFITKENINNIFKKYNVPHDFDFLSIDIDSHDFYVWKNLEYRPIIVIIEVNTGIKNKFPLVIDDNNFTYDDIKEGYFGANIHAFYKLAVEKGYKLLTMESHNAFFVVNEKFKQFNIKEISLENCINNYNKIGSWAWNIKSNKKWIKYNTK